MDIHIPLEGFFFGLLIGLTGLFQGSLVNWLLLLSSVAMSFSLKRIWVAPLVVGIMTLLLAVLPTKLQQDIPLLVGVAIPMGLCYAPLVHWILVRIRSCFSARR